MKNDHFGRCVAPAFMPSEPKHQYDGLTEMNVAIKHIPDIKLATDMFVAMVGGEYDFYGMEHSAVKLNDMIFEILDDPNDGYRSYLGAARIADSDSQYRFFRKPIAKIRIEAIDGGAEKAFEGYHFIDTKDNHVWCRIGTSYIDDYYPSFTCSYYPKLKTESSLS